MQLAAAAVLLCGEEIFIIRRQNYLRAFPGYYAFPGGKVDEEDHQFSYHSPAVEGIAPELFGALCRELQEELQFDLIDALEKGDVEEVAPFGIAITPPFERFRFSAHYFKVVLKKKPPVIPDPGEIAWGGWMNVDEIWERYEDGQGIMVVPVQRTVEALHQDINTVSVNPLNLEYDDENELPYIEIIHELGIIPVSSNTLPPAKYTYALHLGDAGHPKVLVDPSPDSPEIMQLLLKTLAVRPIDRILITHHHHDHHEHAPAIARALGVPICCTEKTHQRLVAHGGEGYMDGVDVEIIKEGSLLTRWLGRDVRCYELPGHDDGMVGFGPEDMSWIMVADLVQPMATVVIPEDVGDMSDYFDSLQRVIDMKPRVVLSSHGMPAGGTELIKNTLAHRQEREAQIDRLHKQGLDQDEITEMIYTDVPEKLYSLARQNVRQHLRKLGVEIN